MDSRNFIGLILLSSLFITLALIDNSQAVVAQTPEMTYNEAQTVYLGNLARRANGVPPLRWNAQLTDAARWFSWDSVENRPDPYCGHQDTQGKWPSDRVVIFGYKGYGGAENGYCGYLPPQSAIDGWMNSSGHRSALLDPNSREVGLGYYRRTSDGRGYVTQDFGHDPVFPPVIIENEAINVTSPSVGLYVYDREAGGGFSGMAPAAQMMVSNDPCFIGASWEPYAAEKAWTLAGGQGWRSVYVKTRDVLSRTATVSDTIYLGANVPLGELGAAQLSTTRPQVTLYGLDGGGLPQVQFSLDWLADDTFETFGLNRGNGGRVNDAAAWGGTAFRLYPGGEFPESAAWVWTTDFIKDVPLVAYFRLKVNDNTSTGEVARVSVKGGGTQYGPLSLKGTDFAAPNRYQEFPLAFTFNTSPNDVFLIFDFARSGSADVYVDAVSIFTTPRPVSSTMTWTVPGGNYRGQGVWTRYTNGGSQFSAISEASTAVPSLSAAPGSLAFFVARDGDPPQPATVTVGRRCGSFAWQASSDAAWLHSQANGDALQISVNQAGLASDTYTGTLTVSAVGVPGVQPASVTVRLRVIEHFYPIYLPIVRR